MSFRFNWPEFDPTFYAEAKTQLETALNKEKKSKHIAGHIFVKELNMGSKAPELEILEICELSTDYFRGIFKLTYRGDSSIAIQTKIQANPLYNPPMYNPPHNGNHYPLPRHSRPDIVAAAQPLVIPMLLRISDVRLSGIIVLSVSKSKGITLVFKNDALESLLVSSTFDIVSSVKSFLQQQIESQLRTFLLDTLPLVVHEFSLRHINDQRKQELRDKRQLQINRLTSSPSPSIYTPPLSEPSTSPPLHQQRQQQYYDNGTNDYVDTFTTSDGNGSDIFPVPDLTSSSSSSSVSESFSDTSSENLSYVLNDGGDDLFHGSTHMATNYEKYVNCNNAFMTTTPLQYLIRSMKRINSSSYDNGTDHEEKQSYISHSSTTTMDDDDTTDFFEYQHHYHGYTGDNNKNNNNNKDPGSSLFSSATTCQLDPTPSPAPTILFDQPVTLSSAKHHPHGLLQRVQNLSALTQTLAIVPKDTLDGLVHKTGITNEQLSTSTRRKKIPKRRIVRWNP